MNAPIAVAVPGDQSVPQRRELRGMDVQLLPHHRVERLLRLLHDRRAVSRARSRRQALRFVDDRQLLFLEVRHELHLLPLDFDLVRVHFGFALRRQIAARSHRQRIGNRAGHAADDHDVRRDVGAEDAGDETEVRRQPVVEPVHDAAEIAAGTADVPRLAFAAHGLGQLARVDRGVGRDVHRGLVRLAVGCECRARPR